MRLVDGAVALAAERATLESGTALEARLDLAAAPRFGLADLSGRLVEIAAQGAAAPLTQALGLVLEAQVAGEPAAWISTGGHSFFPPDAAALGVDLTALPVLRVPDAQGAGRAADKLLRSGAFALVVVDLAEATTLPSPLLARLSGLARKHHSALVFLTEQQEQGSPLGSFISLRAQSLRRREGQGFVSELRVLKDRRRGPGWSARQRCRGVAGLG